MWNRYSYVGNRPIILNDPTGHEGGDCYDRGYCQKDYRDLTAWLVLAAVDITNSPEMQNIKVLNTFGGDGGLGGKITAFWEFKGLVGDGKKYDVKDEIKNQLGNKTKIGDQWFEYSTAGNILYGFYGRAVGFSKTELRAGAGYAQWADYKRDPKNGVGPCDSKHFCDTKVDYYAVGFGMYLYDEYYERDNQLTQTDLLEAMEKYQDIDKMDVVNAPKTFRPQRSYYPPNPFYHME